jgi:type IV secretory pathway VirB9-like protein
MEQDAGNTYNEQIFAQDKDNLPQKWFSYVQNVLLKRSTQNNILWYVPFANETELEKQYFSK